MNEKKICFISRVNDEIVWSESVKYIQNLSVPEGFEIEVISVNAETSIAKAYNRAMKSSNAKYKIYLSEGILIINKNFITDFLTIFNVDKSIGMMGVIGSKSIPISGNLRDSNNKFGKTYQTGSYCMEFVKYKEVNKKYEDVKVIDGSIMITQYDIDWREDLFDSCYLYDISQSTEFILKGYRIVVPNQMETWCINSLEDSRVGSKFKKYTDIFWNEYCEKIYPINEECVCFSCITSLHVFTSYVLSKTVYKDNYKIIMLSNLIKNVVEAYNRIKLSDIWDEVILIDETKPQFQLEIINWKKVGALHYYSWGSPYNSILFDYISDRTKVILTDEGISTYEIKEVAELLNAPVDFDRISEIWLYDKRLFMSSMDKPLKDIEFKKYIDSDLKYTFCKELNYIFNYKHKDEKFDIVFFDQHLYKSGMLSMNQEKYLLLNIMMVLDNLEVIIKKHPTDDIEKYYNYNITNKVYEQDVPYELIHLNNYVYGVKINKSVYMTYASTALVSNIYMFKDVKSKYILLHKLLFGISGNEYDIQSLMEFIKAIEDAYKIKFIDIDSFYELSITANKLFDKQVDYERLLKKIIDYQNVLVMELLKL